MSARSLRRWKPKPTRKTQCRGKSAGFSSPAAHPEITQYILNNFRQKTHRTFPGAKGFNAMLAVSSVEAAKAYYSTFKVLQEEAAKNQAAINAFGLQPSSPLLQMKSKAPLVILLTKALIPAR